MKVKITEKPYYKKYFKKMVIVLKRYKNLPKYSYFNSSDKKYNEKYNSFYKESIKYIDTVKKQLDVKSYIPYRSGKITFYYNDDLLEKLIDKSKFVILEKYIPVNEKQIELQKNEINVLCRKNYFYSLYKYRLELRLSNKRIYQTEFNIEKNKNLKDIKTTLSNLYKTSKDDFYSIKETRLGANIYLTDEDTMFYLLLLYEGYILKSSYIVLEQDI